MSLGQLSDLDEYSRRGQFPAGWGEGEVDWGRVFFGDEDDVPGALSELVRSATVSLFGALDIGKDDGGLVEALINRLTDPDVYVQLVVTGCTDSLLGPWSSGSVVKLEAPGWHRRLLVIDSADVVNVADAGGDLWVLRDATFAAYYQAHLARVHTQALSLLAHHHQEAT